MACFKRIIKSGIRLYKTPGTNFAASTINRHGAAANAYGSLRSFCSSSSDDGRSVLSNAKRSYNFDTFAMVSALKAEGVPLKDAEAVSCSMAEVLAELQKYPTQPSTMLQTKFESLRKNIKKMQLESAKDTPDSVKCTNLRRERRRLLEELASYRSAETATRLIYKEARALEKAKGEWRIDMVMALGFFGLIAWWISSK